MKTYFDIMSQIKTMQYNARYVSNSQRKEICWYPYSLYLFLFLSWHKEAEHESYYHLNSDYQLFEGTFSPWIVSALVGPQKFYNYKNWYLRFLKNDVLCSPSVWIMHLHRILCWNFLEEKHIFSAGGAPLRTLLLGTVTYVQFFFQCCRSVVRIFL